MAVLIGVFFVPAVFTLCLLIFSFNTKDPVRTKFARYSLVSYLIFLGLGTKAILSSRASTASIGFIFLPYYSMIPSLLAGTYSYFKNRWAKFALGSVQVVLMGAAVFQIYKVNELNASRDAENARQAVEIQKNREWVKSIEREQPTKAAELLAEKANGSTDRTILIPIAESSVATEDLLTKLSEQQDLGVLLTVVRNKNTPPEILKKIFMHSSYPPYFFQALSSNPKTPKEILLELYEKRNVNTGIEQSLASNSAIPTEIIVKLSESSNALVLGELVRNPAIDCDTASKAFQRLKGLSIETQYLSTGLGWANEGIHRCTKK